MISLRQLLDLWGFTSHPFEAYTAESEPRLSEYFVEPPYLDDMVGSAASMTPAIVFGARGIGKSAIRIHIENICARQQAEQQVGGRALAITYDDFTRVVSDGLNAATLDKHLEAILGKAVTAALTVIADTHRESPVSEASILERFPRLDIDVFSRLVVKYFSPLTELQRERAFRGIYNYFKNEALSVTDRVNWFQNLWSTLRVPLIDIANLVQAVRGKDMITATELAATKRSVDSSAEGLISDLYAVAALTEQLGFDGWYVLIDKVDEDEHTDSDAAKSAKLILPLIKNLRILETPRIGFKFFLWNQLRPMLNEERVRLDKIRNWEMDWTPAELHEMIDRRLETYSNGRVKSLLSISEPDAADVYNLVIAHAMSSPREIVHVLDSIFREHARHSDQDTGVLLSPSSVDRGLDDYCNRRVRDLYDSEVIRTITQLPATRFTSSDVQSVLRISKQSASVRINRWMDDGHVERIEDSRSGKDPSKAINQYEIKDKRLDRIISRGLMSDSERN
jgi:hypothetical protein